VTVEFHCPVCGTRWRGYAAHVPEGAIVRKPCERHESKWLPPAGQIVTSMDDPGFAGGPDDA
jgi:hypothetical protein